jgi:hypothetical protein
MQIPTESYLFIFNSKMSGHYFDGDFGVVFILLPAKEKNVSASGGLVCGDEKLLVESGLHVLIISF